MPRASSKSASQSSSAVPSVGFVSLGCAKALVDSERILTRLRAEGYAIAPDYSGSDLVIVNTCGFLDSAREESLAAIGEALNDNGKVIVTGCLGAEPEVITAKYPNVLAITGPQHYEAVMDAVHRAVPRLHEPYVDLVPEAGIRLTPRHYAYLKISEGCNNRCSFCIIPHLRGDLVSRPVTDVLAEAEALVKSGVKELLVISQDTSAYGVDVKYAGGQWRGREVKTNMHDLAEALGELGVWVRMHYVYPYPHVDSMLALMAEGKILPYLDIPFQHASPTVLKAMKRPASIEKTAARIAKWREQVPDITLRSTFIVGFPGETEADFQFLLDWMEEVQLDRVGCFKYEDVKGAPANGLTGHVPQAVKEERYGRFMEAAQNISAAKLQQKIGTTQAVIVDGIADGQLVCRTRADAPEIDGNAFAPAKKGVRVGDMVNLEILDADAYDVYGAVVK
ncbi:MAG: 30S ribosomal protein S12 methylthiotransferase RimO [Rickettsiales bacterium]